jgi:hypothetical protein
VFRILAQRIVKSKPPPRKICGRKIEEVLENTSSEFTRPHLQTNAPQKQKESGQQPLSFE